MMPPVDDRRAVALALLNGNHRLTPKAGQFLGQLAVDPNATLTEKQQNWYCQLFAKIESPPIK